MSGLRDRAALLRESTLLNGIDFVEIASDDQKTLLVHFLSVVAIDDATLRDLDPVTITGGESVPELKPQRTWLQDAAGRPLLRLTVAAPGDFSTYTLRLHSRDVNDPKLDRFYDHAAFSFKALCPSNIDCEAPAPACPPLPREMPPIDYLAKDFLSFRAALSDFSAARYPEWQERSAPDVGVVFMEALCAVADDLSYLQDRIAAEATLETATERRSIVRHARLVDYEPRPAISSRVLLQFDVFKPINIKPGVPVLAQGADGTRIDFVTGTGLADKSEVKVSPLWNRAAQLTPYIWDDDDQCLPAGSTEAWIAGHGYGFAPGQQLLIETSAVVEADPPTRQVVTLVALPADQPAQVVDVLFNQPVTHIRWRAEDRLQRNHDLGGRADGTPRTRFAGNLVPATQGRLVVESFTIPDATGVGDDLAIVRTGARDGERASLQYLYTLGETPLAWLPSADDETFVPEISVKDGAALQDWGWRPRLIDAASSDRAFAIEPFRMRAIGRNSDGSTSHEYDGRDGDTIRFGDGTFGAAPAEGTDFTVSYRTGEGARGNVAPDAITTLAPGAPSEILGVTNPFAAEGGADAEDDERVRRLAPHAFRATQFRAVRSEDYVAAAETLPWVSKAGSVFRWSGSWTSVFTTVDPRAAEAVGIDRRIELLELLNRYRLAGYDSYTPQPRFVSVDLTVTVCARSDAFRGDVEEGLREALSVRRFFHPDAFTFGTPLERSALEAAVQSVNGVGGVLSIRYRRRGTTGGFLPLPPTLRAGKDEILRVDNDPSRPERGAIRIVVEGGK